MNSKEIREGYLKFFENKGHLRLKSSSLIPQDPTLLFTVAGMVPLKGYFLGEETPPSQRITTVQKCLRTNDIENVGITKRHHTFFEMLGNFSIGDYFKEDAINWAFEFSTEFLKLPLSNLWVTIYKDDIETRDIWKRVGIPSERIIPLGEADNFWTMGPVGPCGPCSEIYFDRGARTREEEEEIPGGNGERFLEFWNLVFTQFDRQSDGTLNPLPRKNIDTGMGLERVTSIIEGTDSDFETDLFLPIIGELEKITHKHYDTEDASSRYFKAIADHTRAIAFLIADGLLPSNEKRGYVLRRLIRRAELFGHNLGLTEPFLYNTATAVINIYEAEYPELRLSEEMIEKTIKGEESRFNLTLNSGFEFFNDIMNRVKKTGENIFPAESVFYLSDTLGFPLELSQMLIEENGLTFDRDEYEVLLNKQREKAKFFADTSDSYSEKMTFSSIRQEVGETVFVGYERVMEQTYITGIIRDGELLTEANEGEEVSIVINKTPFYAEKGGQIGDSGLIKGESFDFEVYDTQSPVQGLTLHVGKVVRGKVEAGADCTAAVDAKRRQAIKRSHTSVHILQAVLRNTFGNTLRQQGSYVKPDEFRFDFNFDNLLSQVELSKIEQEMNEIILDSKRVYTEELSIDEAMKQGALAFFEEKYGDRVRVVSIEEVSKEFCGGTHVSNTSEISLVVLTSFRTVASGIKRIEGLSGRSAYEFLSSYRRSVREVSALLGVNETSLSNKIKLVLDEVRKSELRKKELLFEVAQSKIANLKPSIFLENVPFHIVELDDVDLNDMRRVFDIAKKHIKEGLVVLVSNFNSHSYVLIGKISGETSALDIFKSLSERFGLKGGGNERLAQGSSDKNISLEELTDFLEAKR
ncbi:MAG: alanine--tRNA ligase [Caldisericaceae bacterium]